MSQVPDPDDIFRVIDEDEENERHDEIKRLAPKLRALKSHHTLTLENTRPIAIFRCKI